MLWCVYFLIKGGRVGTMSDSYAYAYSDSDSDSEGGLF
jgi:hypothetical protein